MLVLWPLGRCRPISAATCVLPGATWHELQNGLQIIASCTGLGGAWERLSCEVKPAATSSSRELLHKWHRHNEFRSCSCVALESLRDIRTFGRMSQGRPHVGWGGVG